MDGERSHAGDATGAPRYLYWPVRSSFLAYVANLADGRASVSDGAHLTLADPQEAVFTEDADHSRAGVLAFRGDLRLVGHGGLLFVRIAHPWIVPGEDGAGQLTVDDPLIDDGSGDRLHLADLTLTRDGIGWRADDVRIAADGMRLFNDMYPAGTPFDALYISSCPPDTAR